MNIKLGGGSIHMERHYIFSGSLTREMADYLKKIDEFEPMDVLVSQVDRSGVKQMLAYKEEGLAKSFFLDSGAFTFHRQGTPVDVDEYIEYANSLDEHLMALAQLDTIPGKFGEPKSQEDYEESARKSWENFLYMYPRMKSPEKLVPVFHYGESFSALKNMLEWRDDEGKPLTYIGISPANDTAQKTKDTYLNQVYDLIKHSSNPNVRTHLFGMTSLQALAKFPYYSADSISHRLRAAYNKLFTRKWGTVSLSDKSRTTKSKSNMSFLQTCDEKTFKEFEALANHYGFTIDQLKESSSARVAMDIVETQLAVKGDYAYNEDNLKRSKKLFSIG